VATFANNGRERQQQVARRALATAASAVLGYHTKLIQLRDGVSALPYSRVRRPRPAYQHRHRVGAP
jgi:hypothetical protein